MQHPEVIVNMTTARLFFLFKKNIDSKEKLLKRLNQARLNVIDSPQKTQQTTAVGRLF